MDKMICEKDKVLTLGRFNGRARKYRTKGVRAIDARNSHLEMAQVLQKPVFALPGCQRMSVNTLLCDTLGLAE